MSCKVHLENYNFPYSPGDEIRGRLECDLYGTTTVKCVKVRLRCRERTFWRRAENYTDSDNVQRSREMTYSGDNDVISDDYILFGSESKSVNLSGGHYVYPFSIVLPNYIPHTYTHREGTITYEIQGIISRPMTSNYKDCYPFKVYAPIDFNKMSTILQEPVNSSTERNVSNWCCGPGESITMELKLPKRAFVPSEEIDFQVIVSNQSNLNIEKLDVNFTETIILKANVPLDNTQKSVFNLVKIQEHGVGAHCEHTYNLKFKISGCITIPNFINCSLFSVDYLFKVSLQMPNLRRNLDITMEDLTVGHIKWGEEDYYRLSMMGRLPLNDGSSAPFGTFTGPLLSLREDLPPSYDEAVEMKKNT